jgi:hypothetical protein
MARTTPLVTTEEAQDFYKHRVKDYADFIQHVSSALSQLREYLSYGPHGSYVIGWPEEYGSCGFYEAMAIAGVRAYRDENRASIDSLDVRHANDVAEWIIYHPIQVMIYDEAMALIEYVWGKIPDLAAFELGEFILYCKICGGEEHLCYA